MEARAIQRTVRQSARKMRLVIDQIRGRAVPEAYAILRFSKKLAAKQIHKVLKSAVANAEQRAQRENAALDVDALRVKYAVVNEGPTLKRFTPAAMGRGFERQASEGKEGGEVQEEESEQISGPESTPLRVPARDHQAVALAVLRPARLPRALERRRPDPQVPEDQAQPRGHRRRAHRAQAG